MEHSQPATAAPEPARTQPANPPTPAARPWWRNTATVWALLLLIVLLGGYFRTLSLTNWDSGTGQHPDERFFRDVTSSVRLPGSAAAYFDSARAASNPRNVGKTFFVYGTLPVILTRVAAVQLTPPEQLPETVQPVSAADTDMGTAEPQPNPERAMPRVPFLQALLNPEGRNLTGYGEIHAVGRWLVVLFDLGSLVLIYLIGTRLFDRRVGLLAALLSALAVMSIQQSHFYVDPIFSTFFTLLTLYWAVRAAQGGGWLTYSMLGASIGLAAASRITLGALALVAIVAAVLAALRPRTSDSPDTPTRAPLAAFGDALLRRSFPLLVLAGVATLVTFRIAHPYAFTGALPDSPPLHSEPSRLDALDGLGFFDVRLEPRFVDNMGTVQRLVTGQDDFPPSQQWVGRTAYLFPWVNMVVWGMGPALGVVVWLAWLIMGGVLLWRLRALLYGRAAAGALVPLVLWFWITFYFGWQGGQFASTMRYMLPIYGALIILGAWLLLWLWDWGRARLHDPPGQVPLLVTRLALVRWSVVLVVLGSLAWAYAFSRIYTVPHSRVIAAEWAAQNIPPGSYITFEGWDDPLPLNVLGGDPWGTTYRGVRTEPYGEDDLVKYTGHDGGEGLIDQLVQADYVSLTSNRVYDSTARSPMRYPALRRYYHYLFTGELGFELVAEITSYPTLLGIPIPDQQAEEAFTVYDHPRVLIFRKTDVFSRERAEQLIIEGVNWSEVYKSPVSLADRSDTALRLTASEWPRYRAGGTWAALFSNPSSIINSDLVAPLLWFAVLELIGLATFALLFRLLPWLPDRGLALARPLGLLLVAYAAWLLGSLKLLPFTPLTLWLCALPLLATGAWLAWRGRAELRAFWRARRGAILSAQAVYLLAFAALVYLRWLNPDLWHPARGGEKPMDVAYLNAVLQSAAFPPYDPWFAGGYINYYYFGFVLVGALVHLTTIIPAVAYNLAVATLGALSALGAWGIVYNLLAPRRTPRPAAPPRWWRNVERRALLAAWLAPLFALLLGNLAQAIWFADGYAAANTHRPEWAFWDATRIVQGTVNEFPFFTFLFADLHAHMMVIPFALAMVGLLVALVRQPWSQRQPAGPALARTLGLLALLGLLAGTLRATNTWDYPTFVGLTVATLALLCWQHFRRAAARPPDDPAADPASARTWQAIRWGLLWLGQVVLVVGLGNLLFAPFISHFATESSGVQLLYDGALPEGWQQVLYAPRTSLWDTLRLFGLWLLLLLSAGTALWLRASGNQRRVPWALGGLAALFLVYIAANTYADAPVLDIPGLALVLPLLLAGVALAWLVRRAAPRRLLPLLWGLLALAIVAGVEIVVVRGDVGRMNTVFKFGLHAWLLFALASAVALPWLWRMLSAGPFAARLAGNLWQLAVLALIGAALVYPATATPARVGDRFTTELPHTLDGTAFMRATEVTSAENGQSFSLREDAEAIAWMQQTIDGTPLILEAHLPSYRWAGRVATFTGLPTLFGWEWHQIQQRNAVGVGPIADARRRAIEEIYGSSDATRALELLHLYGIEYVYVGGVERALYAQTNGLAKFAALAQQGALREVYAAGNTVIYRVVEPGTPTVLTADLPIVAPTLDTPPPLLLETPVGELPPVRDYAWNAWASSSSWNALGAWLLALYALTLLGLPAALLVFRAWGGAALVWARLLGLLLVGYAVWLPTSLGVWRYDAWGLIGGAALVLALNLLLIGWLGRQTQPVLTPARPRPPDNLDAPQPAGRPLLRGLAALAAHLRRHWRGVLLAEGLFLAALAALTAVRSQNPDLWHPVWGGEKPMEFGFLNAILRSPVMPPYDPFFSDGYINYYYYGIYLVTLPIRATGIDPALAFNLIVPTVFALTLAGAYALVAHITGRVRYGLLAALLVTVVGNLASYWPVGWSRGWPAVQTALAEHSWEGLGAALGDWYVGPSRVIDGTINEFPFWTFLFADLHPHMIALPITLLALALAYTLATPPRTTLPVLRWALLLLVALTLGTLAVTNSWDYPSYALLTGAVLLGTAWRSQRRGVPWGALLRAALTGLALMVGGLLLFSPFFDHFYAFVSGVGFVEQGTPVPRYVVQYGLFLAVVLPFVLGTAWRLMQRDHRHRSPRAQRLWQGAAVVLLLVLLGMSYAQPVLALSAWLGMLIALSIAFFLQRGLSTRVWFTLLLLALAWSVSLGVDLIYIRDHLDGNTFYRMNTVFKFGLQIWVLLALAAALCLPSVLRALGRGARHVGLRPWMGQALGLLPLAYLLGLTLLFPLFGTPSRIANRFEDGPPPTLDGLAFLETATFDYNCDAFPGCLPDTESVTIDLAPDAQAIAWLNETVEGTPIVVQSDLWFYRAYGIRVAANTGLPTVVSPLHASEQHHPNLVADRSRDVDTLFRTTDTEATLRVLARYAVDYIYVGPIERAFYPSAGLSKFDDMTGTYLEMVYSEPGAQIYRVSGVPASYASLPTYDFTADELARAERAAAPELPADAPTSAESEPPAENAPAANLEAQEAQVAANPTNGPLVFGLASTYRQLGRLGEAADVLAVAAAASPRDIGLHHLWGDILAEAGRYDEAEGVFRRVLAVEPSAGNWNKLAAGLVDWGRPQRAEALLDEALAAHPDAADLHFSLGRAYAAQGQRENARTQFATYLRLAPDGPLAGQARSNLDALP